MTFTIVDQGRDTIEALIPTAVGPVTVVCRVSLRDDRVILYDLHVHGPGPGSLGPARLRALVHSVMEQSTSAPSRSAVSTCTTGAAPGRLPLPPSSGAIELRLRGWRPRLRQGPLHPAPARQ